MPLKNNIIVRPFFLKGISDALALLVIAFGLFGLLGWYLDQQIFRNLFFFQTYLRPNGAFCFLLSGLGLYMHNQAARYNPIIRLFTIIVFLIASITLFDYSRGFSSGFESLLYNSSANTLDLKINPISCICYILFSIGLFHSTFNKHPNLNQSIFLTALLLTLLSLAGHVFNATKGNAAFTQMSGPSTFCFLILLSGFLIGKVQTGLMALFFTDNIKGILARRLFPFALLVPFVLGWIRLLGENAGLYNTEFGLALYCIFNVFIFFIIIFWNIKVVGRVEQDRVLAKEEVDKRGTYIKDYSERVNLILERLLKFTMMDFSETIPVSDKSDELDAIAYALNTLAEELQTKNTFIESNQERVNEVMDVMLSLTMMDFSKRATVSDRGDEWDAISLGLNTLAEELEASIQLENKRRAELERYTDELNKQNSILSILSEINEVVKGQKSVDLLSQDLINKICVTLSIPVGCIYTTDEEGLLRFSAGYGYSGSRKTIKFGETLVGQAALERRPILFKDFPEEQLIITTAINNFRPRAIYILPFLYEDKVMGVIELGFVHDIEEFQEQYMKLVLENIGIAYSSAISREKLQDLFIKTRTQAEELEKQTMMLQASDEELRAQQEELKQTNEELNRQTQVLQASEEELRVQQEELQQANQELEEKTLALEENNRELEVAKHAISKKADEVELTSKYKSEFLANMSHELRTPLNSVLILAKLLYDNKAHNLTEKQVEFARIIHKSGNDLLNLINDILDLSKIEAGKVELMKENYSLNEVKRNTVNLFHELANSKGINFNVDLSESLESANIFTDRIRLDQILRNLLSNSFKFTEKEGSITFIIRPSALKNKIEFIVKDNGIGIPKEKLNLIFEAFQQVDGSTSRKYGGTGLGLSITRELVHLLGGEMTVNSELGKGSEFKITLPIGSSGDVENVEVEQQEPKSEELIQNIEQEPSSTDKVILIIEDDENFATVLKEYAENHGFKTLIAHQGDKGLELARKIKPSAIILDLQLPVIDGWAVIKHIKEDKNIKHIPVHIVSGMDKEKSIKKLGAVAYLKKPLTADQLDETFRNIMENLHKIKNVLVVEDNEIHNSSIISLIQSQESDVKCTSALSGKEALKVLEEKDFDCIILDLNLKDMSGQTLLEMIKSQSKFAHIPVIINTGKDLTMQEERRLKNNAATVIVKSSESSKRLLDEVTLFLHKVEEISTPSPRKHTINMEDVLKGKTVLLTDDDMRNVFSLKVALEEYGLKIIAAGDGKEALQKLKENPKIDLILMDIMMPELDGYETMREIRRDSQHEKLPIIALTAKAMKGDREKCIEAGASDYISKPVNVDQLVSLMRTWLC